MNKSETYFNLIAHIYDQATGDPGAWTPPDVIYDNINSAVTKYTSILDIGIGTGQSIKKIYNTGLYKEIHGVDVSQKMLDICKERYPSIKLTHISSVKDISYICSDFDVVISCGTIEFIQDIEELFKIIRTKQKNGAIFVFTYEPMIRFHSCQNERKSLTVSNESSNLYIKDFYTYRYNPCEILSLLNDNGYAVKTDSEFVSYKKGEDKIIYHIIVALAV